MTATETFIGNDGKITIDVFAGNRRYLLLRVINSKRSVTEMAITTDEIPQLIDMLKRAQATASNA